MSSNKSNPPKNSVVVNAFELEPPLKLNVKCRLNKLAPVDKKLSPLSSATLPDFVMM